MTIHMHKLESIKKHKITINDHKKNNLKVNKEAKLRCAVSQSHAVAGPLDSSLIISSKNPFPADRFYFIQ